MVYSLLGAMIAIFSSLANLINQRTLKFSIFGMIFTITGLFLYQELFSSQISNIDIYVLTFTLGCIFKGIFNQDYKLNNITEILFSLIFVSFENSLVSNLFLSTYLIIFGFNELNRQVGALLAFSSVLGLLSWINTETSLLLSSIVLIINLFLNLFWIKKKWNIESNFLYLVAIIQCVPDSFFPYGITFLGLFFIIKLLKNLKDSDNRLLSVNSLMLIVVSHLGFVVTPEILLLFFLTSINWFSNTKIIYSSKSITSSDAIAIILALMIFTTQFLGASIEIGMLLLLPYLLVILESKKRSVKGAIYIDELVLSIVGLLILIFALILKFPSGGLSG